MEDEVKTTHCHKMIAIDNIDSGILQNWFFCYLCVLQIVQLIHLGFTCTTKTWNAMYSNVIFMEMNVKDNAKIFAGTSCLILDYWLKIEYDDPGERGAHKDFFDRDARPNTNFR